ncbi:choice-of-anchor V domain-containing protein [Taibaiella chishuiensis]|uniref:Putative secreted protein (Por secretion system target) n=1 Tax=Taibaiella chishuiensis TaxID=1434707 RepID=A0A2P8CY19_9BACT|nr:choice-of-anchor V domain-containing protein [Taibaiella chishuiensis]PSK89871.1 putative secreted protein (Por secretion system target) [Taibaiella chishuiensis]
MKRSFILFPVILAGLYLSLSSNSSGPASAGNGIRNGGPGSNGTCASCHGGGAGTTTMTIALKEKANGTAANGKYKPGTVYTVTISGNNTNLAFFGFQLTAATAGSQQAGTFGNLGSDKHAVTIGGLQVVEHGHNLSKTNGAYLAEFDWTAPAAGTGNVTLYGIINGVNDDNGITGDKASAPVTLPLTEATNPTSVQDLAAISDLRVYPNPATDQLHLGSDQVTPGNYQVTIYDMTGREVLRQAQQAGAGKLQVNLAIGHLPAGSYILHLNGKQQAAVHTFVKQ